MTAQHFKRAFRFYSPTNKTGILVTAYHYQHEAKTHLQYIEDDRYSALINCQHSKHLSTIPFLNSSPSSPKQF
jgi:hypothetical protein